MPDASHAPDAVASAVNDATVTTTSRRERNRSQRTGSRGRTSTSSPRWMRRLFFGAAGVWGFVIGVAALAWSQRLAGAEVVVGGGAMTVLLPGIAVATLGGFLVAGAYGENRRRRR